MYLKNDKHVSLEPSSRKTKDGNGKERNGKVHLRLQDH